MRLLVGLGYLDGQIAMIFWMYVLIWGMHFIRIKPTSLLCRCFVLCNFVVHYTLSDLIDCCSA